MLALDALRAALHLRACVLTSRVRVCMRILGSKRLAPIAIASQALSGLARYFCPLAAAPRARWDNGLIRSLGRKKLCAWIHGTGISARVCDLLGSILRRWEHGPPLYSLHRHPGPPSETKGARASGARGGGFNDLLGGIPPAGVVFPALRGVLVPDLGDRAYPRAPWCCWPTLPCLCGHLQVISRKPVDWYTQA